MKCPFCASPGSRVIDSRPAEDGAAIRRRRECVQCLRRFSTYEKAESVAIYVIKKDGRHEVFDADKMHAGLMKACEKLPVAISDIDNLVSGIERQLQNDNIRQISSDRLGEMVMDRLKALNEVAYVRFAAVYRPLKDLNTLVEELNKLMVEQKGTAE